MTTENNSRSNYLPRRRVSPTLWVVAGLAVVTFWVWLGLTGSPQATAQVGRPPTGEEAEFLPVIQRPLPTPTPTPIPQCIDFFDDFSDPLSGWPEIDDDAALIEYTGSEYRILTRLEAILYAVGSPVCDWELYSAETLIHWSGDQSGNAYGVVFGIANDFSEYYLAVISSDTQQAQMIHIYPGGYSASDFFFQPAINPGSGNNLVKVSLTNPFGYIGATVTVNGSPIFLDWVTEISGPTGSGVFSASYADDSSSDARFDNYQTADTPNQPERSFSGAGSPPPATAGWTHYQGPPPFALRWVAP